MEGLGRTLKDHHVIEHGACCPIKCELGTLDSDVVRSRSLHGITNKRHNDAIGSILCGVPNSRSRSHVRQAVGRAGSVTYPKSAGASNRCAARIVYSNLSNRLDASLLESCELKVRICGVLQDKISHMNESGVLIAGREGV